MARDNAALRVCRMTCTFLTDCPELIWPLRKVCTIGTDSRFRRFLPSAGLRCKRTMVS